VTPRLSELCARLYIGLVSDSVFIELTYLVTRTWCCRNSGLSSLYMDVSGTAIRAASTHISRRVTPVSGKPSSRGIAPGTEPSDDCYGSIGGM
jgi:hypothetical protein